MDQSPAVAFTAFADVSPRATRNGDRRRPMRQWRGRNFDFFEIDIRGYIFGCEEDPWLEE